MARKKKKGLRGAVKKFGRKVLPQMQRVANVVGPVVMGAWLGPAGAAAATAANVAMSRYTEAARARGKGMRGKKARAYAKTGMKRAAIIGGVVTTGFVAGAALGGTSMVGALGSAGNVMQSFGKKKASVLPGESGGIPSSSSMGDDPFGLNLGGTSSANKTDSVGQSGMNLAEMFGLNFGGLRGAGSPPTNQGSGGGGDGGRQGSATDQVGLGTLKEEQGSAPEQLGLEGGEDGDKKKSGWIIAAGLGLLMLAK